MTPPAWKSWTPVTLGLAEWPDGTEHPFFPLLWPPSPLLPFKHHSHSWMPQRYWLPLPGFDLCPRWSWYPAFPSSLPIVVTRGDSLTAGAVCSPAGLQSTGVPMESGAVHSPGAAKGCHTGRGISLIRRHPPTFWGHPDVGALICPHTLQDDTHTHFYLLLLL